MIYRLSKFVAINFYLFFCIASFLECLGIKTPIIILAKAVCIIFAVYCVCGNTKLNCKGTRLLALCGIYALSTGIFYLDASQPFGFFISGLQDIIWPSIFYLFAFEFSEKEIELFRNRTVIAFIFAYIVGLYLYFVQPGWYINWRITSYESWLGSNAENFVLSTVNLTSFFFHTYVVGYTSFCLSSYFLYRIYTAEVNPKREYLLLFICLLVGFFAQQRVSVTLSVILMFFYIILEIKNGKHRIYYFVIPIVLFSVIYIGAHLSDFEVMLTRYTSVIDGSVLDDGRSVQWQAAFRNFDSWLFGRGLNIVGHPAAGTNFPCIADGEFFKNLYELGIIGCTLFYSFCFVTARCATKHPKKFAIEIPILIGFICMEYGANPFEMGNIIPFYWFAAGLVWRNSIKRNNQINIY